MARWGRQPCSLPRVIGGTCVTFLGFLRLALFQCDRLLFPGKLGRCLPFLLNCKHCLFLRKTQRLLRGGRPASASCVAAAPVSTTNTWAAGGPVRLVPHSQPRVLCRLCCHTWLGPCAGAWLRAGTKAVLVSLAPGQNGIFPPLTTGGQTFHYLKIFCGLHERNSALRMKML